MPAPQRRYPKSVILAAVIRKMLKQHFIDTYGEVIYKKTTQMQRLKKQAASSKCRWIFMSKCLKHKVLPKSFQTKPVLRTRKGFRLTREYNRKMLEATRDETLTQYHLRLQKIDEISKELEENVTQEDHATVRNVTEKSREQKFQKESKRLKEKFEKLCGVGQGDEQEERETWPKKTTKRSIRLDQRWY